MRPPLARATLALVDVSAAAARGDGQALDRTLEEARAAASPVQVEEALLQCHLFLGYPTALDALARWRAVAGPCTGGVGEEPEETHRSRGERTFRTVYGSQEEAVRRKVRDLHPDMERWMVVDGYGKVLSREGLSLQDRELCVVAVLAVADHPAQLHSHLRGALNAGARPEAVAAALERAARRASPEAAERAREVWNAVLERHRAAGDGSG